jgi:hypothetical protein
MAPKDTVPAKKKSKNSHTVEAMMLQAASSSNTMSSLSSSSPSSAGDNNVELHLVPENQSAPAWKFFKLFNLRFEEQDYGARSIQGAAKTYYRKDGSTCNEERDEKKEHGSPARRREYS